MASTDPLDLLRQSIATPSLAAALLTDAGALANALPDASSFSFPQPDGKDAVIIPKDAPTRYARTDAREDFYSVGQLWLAWTERDTGVREYLMKGQAAGVGYVAITDRRGVVDFLQGSSDGGARVLGKGEDRKCCGGVRCAVDNTQQQRRQRQPPQQPRLLRHLRRPRLDRREARQQPSASTRSTLPTASSARSCVPRRWSSRTATRCCESRAAARSTTSRRLSRR